MKPTDLTAEDNHLGGYYELAIELGDRDDARLDAALAATWTEVDGCLRQVGWSPARFEPAARTAEALVECGHLHGVVSTPLGRTVCCAVAVREDGGTDCELGSGLPAERYVGYVLPDGERATYHPANA